MRRTSGQLAYFSAIGGGFVPLFGGGIPFGEHSQSGIGQADGTYVTVMVHGDGRSLAIRTAGPGNGWQRGRFVRAVAGGEWLGPMGAATVTRWQDVRRLLADHQPNREHPYCGGAPIRQPRALDGRERDILTRILRDILRAAEDAEGWRRLQGVVPVDVDEVYQLMEMRAVLDARDD